MMIPVRLGADSYEILLQRGGLLRAGESLNLNRRVLIVTDDGVPDSYAQTVAAQCKTPLIRAVPGGEGSKSMETLTELLSAMLRAGFTRGDCVVAVGGGVVGDLAGFAAACYMRGVDFYNIPTTVLSQVDSSIGGKTAVNLDGIKNIVGAFYQPKAVLIDMDTLDTLPQRQISAGLAEAVKMALIFDAALFARMETEGFTQENAEAIIARSLELKAAVVEADEKEQGLRKTLNFGHTIGHGIESVSSATLYHGECVALGMLPMCAPDVRARLVPVLQKLSLPLRCAADPERVYAAMLHDKKSAEGRLSVIRCPRPGAYEMECVEPAALRDGINMICRGATE
ncbi:MAG: 3-dehydroquinate synthase [Oscillospiraceae bacterium]|nr:3-dehydroquinate synthase [Oscillospiraceae bacterium]